MMNRRIFGPVGTGLICLVMVCLFSCSSKEVNTGMLIATQAPANYTDQSRINEDSWRFIAGARIIAFEPGKPEQGKILTKDFYSAAHPEISYDGNYMLFTAQKQQADPWEIWEMDFKSLKSRKITSSDKNCVDPVYLPSGKLAFSGLTVNDTVRKAYCLYTCNSDGSGLKQITFNPNSVLATTVLKDGRLLSVCRQSNPEKDDPILTVMRPDGTKADMFYSGEKGCKFLSNACETYDGKIVFIESGPDNADSGKLISILYNRPLHSKVNVAGGTNGSFKYVLPLRSGKFLVSYKKPGSDRFSLFEFDPAKRSLEQQGSSDLGYDLIDIALVEAHEIPKKLPSEVDLKVKTGLLLCQDINFPGNSLAEDKNDVHKALKIEVLGIDTTYGVVRVEADGSFYLKVMADKPFRIRTIDSKGNIVSGPCSWMWLRPNERRGCVGCHEDPEFVPDNKVSLAIKKSPVIIPVHITKVNEKIVELE
jgi:Hydrazine synthase alpha subunit middle domain